MERWTDGTMERWNDGPMVQRTNGPMDQESDWRNSCDPKKRKQHDKKGINAQDLKKWPAQLDIYYHIITIRAPVGANNKMFSSN